MTPINLPDSTRIVCAILACIFALILVWHIKAVRVFFTTLAILASAFALGAVASYLGTL